MSPEDQAPTQLGRAGRGSLLRFTRVLSKYGFAFSLHRIGLGPWIPRRLKPKKPVGMAGPVAFRRALEELGPTWVKLGQAVSTRGDVLPPEWVEELRELQDHVAPAPFEAIREVVEAEFGRPLEEVFPTFEEEPIASASIGQVHYAELPSGESVAVKVQRPGMAHQVDGDLAALQWLAGLTESKLSWAADYRVTGLVADFARRLRGELDYKIEAQNTKTLGAVLEDDPRARVPRVFDQVSGERVITTEWVTGLKADNTEGLEEAGVDRSALARSLAGLILKQILHHGCFHADPHGGNVLVTPTGGIVLLDCGNVAYCPPHMRDDLVYLLFSMLEGDTDEVVAQITSVGLPTDDTDMAALQADINRHIVNLHSLSTADISIGEVLNELLYMIARHRIIMPPIFALIIRALILVDGECRALDPRFDFREAARTVVSDTMRTVTRPRRAAMEAYRMARSLHQHALLLPRQLLSVLRKVDSSGLGIRLKEADLEKPMHRLDGMFNRLAFSVVVAAMILAPALWMQARAEAAGALSYMEYMPYVVLAIGFALGSWLLISIIRSGRL